MRVLRRENVELQDLTPMKSDFERIDLLHTLTVETFAELVGDRFALGADPDAALDLELIEANPLGARPGRGRAPFSILFRGPLAPVMPQRIYPITLQTLGCLELFIVPIGPRDGGMVYEAVFT
jgi:hypothetical protein